MIMLSVPVDSTRILFCVLKIRNIVILLAASNNENYAQNEVVISSVLC
jgi:hypothetical protein